MISVSLPAVHFGSRVLFPEVLEAAALTLWSSYNDQPVDARVRVSMIRSWQLLDEIFVPRPGGGVPGMVICRIGTEQQFRVVIAIESIRGIGDLFTTNGIISPVNPGVGRGQVFHLAYDDFVALRAIAMGIPTVAAWLTNPNIPVTFTGHSLGAAIAEVWACVLKYAIPAKWIKAIKFGCPNVGNETWATNPSHRVTKCNVLTRGDHISKFPTISAPRAFASWGPGIVSTTRYVRDSVDYCINNKGNQFDDFVDRFNYRSLGLLYWLTQPLTDANPWSQHVMPYYRLALCSLAYVSGGDGYYRFKNLEFNDENRWQVYYNPNDDMNESLFGLMDPAPAAVPPTSGQIQMIAEAMGEGVGGWDADTLLPEGGIGGGSDDDWVAPPVVITALRPQRRRRLQAQP